MSANNQKTSINGDLDEMLLHTGGSKFLLVNVVRLRAAQLTHGAPPLTTLVNPNKPVSTAFNEVAAAMIPYTSTHS